MTRLNNNRELSDKEGSYMDKDKLNQRLSYVKEHAVGLLGGHDTFKSRKLLHEAILELCSILEELNEDKERERIINRHY